MDIYWVSNYSRTLCITWWCLMTQQDCDIIEVKLLDPSYRLYYRGKSKINNLKDLNVVLENKAGVVITKAKKHKRETGWFD